MRLIDGDELEKCIKKNIDSLEIHTQHYNLKYIPVEAVHGLLHSLLKEVQNQPGFGVKVVGRAYEID